jgi:hypothetical protein
MLFRLAYKFVAGLNGFPAGDDTRQVWRVGAGGWLHYLFRHHSNGRNRHVLRVDPAGNRPFTPPGH